MTESQRQRQKNETRKRLIETAMDQFAKNGLSATRTADIAAAAEVSHGTVFTHFPTREALMEEVIEAFGMKITERMHELIGDKCGMREVLAAHLEGLEENEDFYAGLISEASVLPQDARNTLIMIQSAISFHIMQVAEREIVESRIKEMPFDLLYNTWLGLIHYYLANRELFAPGASVIAKHGRRLTEHFMNLITKGEEVL